MIWLSLGVKSIPIKTDIRFDDQVESAIKKVIEELDLICSQLDNMSPKDAHDSLYRLKILKESLRD